MLDLDVGRKSQQQKTNYCPFVWRHPQSLTDDYVNLLLTDAEVFCGRRRVSGGVSWAGLYRGNLYAVLEFSTAPASSAFTQVCWGELQIHPETLSTTEYSQPWGDLGEFGLLFLFCNIKTNIYLFGRKINTDISSFKTQRGAKCN